MANYYVKEDLNREWGLASSSQQVVPAGGDRNKFPITTVVLFKQSYDTSIQKGSFIALSINQYNFIF